MITDHRFVGKREWGIKPPQTAPCQVCGLPLSQHAPPCPGMLTLEGKAFPCDLVAPHDGWGHSNSAAQAVWQ